MGLWKGLLAGVALAMAPAALAAQNAGQAQPAPAGTQSVLRMFAYLEPRVRVEIVGQAPGTIQLLRGEDGVLQVTASAPADEALPAVARSANDEITLLSTSNGPVHYIVVVPRSATVTVARAGHPAVAFVTLDHSASWSWPASASAPAELPH